MSSYTMCINIEQVKTKGKIEDQKIENFRALHEFWMK